MRNIEKEIAEDILRDSGASVTTFGLRFDRVAVRVLGALRVSVETAPGATDAILVTLTAPIRSPARTVEQLKRETGALSSTSGRADRSFGIQGNLARIRRIEPGLEGPAKFIGFVHDPDLDPDPLLDLAERWLRSRSRSD